MAQRALDSGQHRRDQIGAKPWQDHLRLGVAEAAVEFDHLRPVPGQHQPDIKDATIGCALVSHAARQRADNLVHHLLLQRIGEPRRGRYRPHAAGVWPLVAVIGALVVLGASHEQHIRPVHQRKQRCLRSGDPFFDKKGRTGIAEPAVQHLRGGVLGLGGGIGDDDALAGGQPVGLDHAGPAAGGDGGAGAADVGADREARLMNAEAGAGLARKCFGAFQLRRCRAWSESRKAGGLQPVDEAGDKRGFRPDHHKVRTFGLGKGEQPVQIIGRHPGTASQRRHGVAPRGDNQTFGQGRSGNGPCQRMFASAAANQENFHGYRPSGRCWKCPRACGGPKPFARTAIWHKNGGPRKRSRPCQPIFCRPICRPVPHLPRPDRMRRHFSASPSSRSC